MTILRTNSFSVELLAGAVGHDVPFSVDGVPIEVSRTLDVEVLPKYANIIAPNLSYV